MKCEEYEDERVLNNTTRISPSYELKRSNPMTEWVAHINRIQWLTYVVILTLAPRKIIYFFCAPVVQEYRVA